MHTNSSQENSDRKIRGDEQINTYREPIDENNTENDLARKMNSECGNCQSENVKNYCHQCKTYFCEKCELTLLTWGCEG